MERKRIPGCRQLSELRSSGLTYRKLVYVFSNCRVAEGTDTRGSRILLMRVEKTITSNHCTLTRELTKILFSTVQVSSPSPLIYLFNGKLCDSDTREHPAKQKDKIYRFAREH